MRAVVLFLFASLPAIAQLPVDTSELREGPISVEVTDAAVWVSWLDDAGAEWRAHFSRDPKKPPLDQLGRSDAQPILLDAEPYLRVETGFRSKGWNAFFDYPPAHPEGTRSFQSSFAPTTVTVRSEGTRVHVVFDGLTAGPFTGEWHWIFFRGSRLVQQQAVVSTTEANIAFLYDMGLETDASAFTDAGKNTRAPFQFFDTTGELRRVVMDGMGPERVAERVRYRAIAHPNEGGAIAAFPAPHQYFFPRDFTSNLGYVWHRSWRNRTSFGIRQIRDANWRFYPWSNAPPKTEQRLSLFLSAGDDAEEALAQTLTYTRRDRFKALPGYKTLAPHWHVAFTVQAEANGPAWVPPWKPILQNMGVDAAMIMDFHGDGHPRDTTELRLKEVEAFYRQCRAQSGADFLLIPGEEANVHFGGHWAVSFPHQVLWWMRRDESKSFVQKLDGYGTVYAPNNKAELLEMIRRENGWVYQTHPRTKSSTGYPDKFKDEEHYLDPTFFGAGWKALPSDFSSPRLGERALDLVDDMNNWGQPKKILGEVDVFQLNSTHELYAHMNINYVRMGALPSFDDYGEILDALDRGEFFVSTGEVLLPSVDIRKEGDHIEVRADVEWTFPLAFAEVVWGDGEKTGREIVPLNRTGEHGSDRIRVTVDAPGWKWVRFAVWDVAANGAFVNPVWRGDVPEL